MRKLSLLLIFLFIVCAGVQAGRKISLKTRIREGYAAIKAETGQEAAERNLRDTLLSPTVSTYKLTLRAEGWMVCAMLEKSINDGLNQKAYLKQNLDTARLYGSVLNMYHYLQKCDSVDAEGKYMVRGAEMRKFYRRNLAGGGRFMLRHNKPKEAWDYLDTYLRTWGQDEEDSLVGKVAFWATAVGVKMESASKMLKYVDLAIDKGEARDRMILSEYRARAYRSIGDSVRWRMCLEDGVKEFPGHDFFFLKLIDYYIHHDELARAKSMTDSLLMVNREKPVFWLAKSLIALDAKDYKGCIAMADSCLERDGRNTDALYNKGIAYLNMTLDEKDQARVKVLYMKSMISMEKLRELEPEAVGRWGKSLYRIYLNLNLGSKFDEIDRVLKRTSL